MPVRPFPQYPSRTQHTHSHIRRKPPEKPFSKHLNVACVPRPRAWHVYVSSDPHFGRRKRTRTPEPVWSILESVSSPRSRSISPSHRAAVQFQFGFFQRCTRSPVFLSPLSIYFVVLFIGIIRNCFCVLFTCDVFLWLRRRWVSWTLVLLCLFLVDRWQLCNYR